MREYTQWERLQNWLHYNKLWIIALAVVFWVAGSMVWNVLGIGQVKPDYRIAYVGSREFDEKTVLTLENALAAFGQDANGDGRVTVVLTQYITGSGSSADSMMYGYASHMEVLANITEGESTFFLLENPVDFQLSYQILANLDGSIPAEDDFAALDKVYPWASCPALVCLDLGDYEDRYLDITETGAIQDLLQNLCLGRRYFHDPAQQKYPEADEAFWQAVTEGATP